MIRALGKGVSSRSCPTTNGSISCSHSGTSRLNSGRLPPRWHERKAGSDEPSRCWDLRLCRRLPPTHVQRQTERGEAAWASHVIFRTEDAASIGAAKIDHRHRHDQNMKRKAVNSFALYKSTDAGCGGVATGGEGSAGLVYESVYQFSDYRVRALSRCCPSSGHYITQ